jgi:hypothetical protein
MIRCYFKHYVGTLYAAYAMVLCGPGPGHVAVVIPVSGGKVVILDPAGKYLTGLDLFLFRWLTPTPATTAINDYLSYWGGKLTGVSAVFNEDTYKEFNTLSEFISWIAQSS